MKPYSEDVVSRLVQYAKIYGIESYKINAYMVSPDKNEQGYTSVANIDLGSRQVNAMALGPSIEMMLKDRPGSDITISSVVEIPSRPMSDCHIPMLDLVLPVSEFNHDVMAKYSEDVDHYTRHKTGRDLFGVPARFVSGNSFHLYGFNVPPFSGEMFNDLLSAMLICDQDKIADHAWIGFCLKREEFRLRLTANQPKYKMAPTSLKWYSNA